MAIGHQGINGPFRGKIGAVVGYTLNGEQVMRSVGKRIKPFTPLELLNQAKMKAVSKFLSPIQNIVKFGYQQEAPPGSRVGAFQLAQSYVRKNAIDLDEEDKPFVNPAKVLISRGTLGPPLNATAELEGNRLTIRWEHPEAGWGEDRLVLLLYDGYLFRHFRESGAERKEGIESLVLDALRRIEQPVHVYAAFRNAFSGEISDSVYCGVLTPPETSG
ncbi:DUF6266 family protein [Parapedobacter sp. 10938]|uniref:DUF6266 family protein n=1 Tax=Parapedobacter flavus TaxID=3110225 RepID=UPI002DBBC7C5|nr:DUF6266 family protein [Parapedobacter sp. 10938]MEC3880775.1 DUF6266 family protein [Parapedobacter sp. 10938]